MIKNPEFLDPKNYISLKKLFGTKENKDIAIRFINDILDLNDGRKIKDIVFLNEKEEPIIDILCTDEAGVQLVVKLQLAPLNGFAGTSQYYIAQAYSDKANNFQTEGGTYSNSREIIFIVISNEILFPYKEDFFSHHTMADAKTHTRDINSFSFIFLELPKFKLTKVEELKTAIDKWCYFFNCASQASYDTLKKFIDNDLVIEKACTTINRLHWTNEELQAYETMQGSV